MANAQLAVMQLIWDILAGKTEGVSKVSYFPQKQVFPNLEIQQRFPRATPESQGITSEQMISLVRGLKNAKEADIHHLMAVRNGYVICECDYAPYRKDIWHVTYSMCKSITGMAIGLLIQEGRLQLQDNLYTIFEKRLNPLQKIFRPVVTIENLLTMTSAVAFNEAGAISGDDWVGAYLSAPVRGTPGTVFEYNSMNTYMLSAVVTELTGMTLLDYLKPRLLEPLGIDNVMWETCPKGITKGGWGLFLCLEDMAKLGQLYLQKGKWKGRQIIPEHWVEISASKQINSSPGTYGYGNQIWMEARPDSFEFNGMLGQNVVIYPDMNLILAFNAGSSELNQDCILLEIVRSIFPPEFHPAERLPENRQAWRNLQNLEKQMSEGGSIVPIIIRGGWKREQRKGHRSSWKEKARRIAGSSYELEQNNIGLFPILMQAAHNNFTSGIRKLEFLLEEEKFYLLVLEGTELHRLEIGMGKAAVSRICVHGEEYLTAAEGVFTVDEEEQMVLKLDIAFLEEASRRKVKFFFGDEALRMEWDETPGSELILEGVEFGLSELENNFIYHFIREKGGVDMIRSLIAGAIHPAISARRTDIPLQ